MSKQTAVDWLYKTHFFKNGELTQSDFEQAKAMEREQIEQALPSKDDAVNFGFRKAINAEYKLRKVCKDSYHDLYYSGWMDCYDWLNDTYKGGEQ